MSKDNKQSKPVPATLWLESIAAFGEHARELNIERAYITVQDTPIPGQMQVGGEGGFTILVSARSETTILNYAEAVKNTTHIDAHVRRDETRANIENEVRMLSALLEAAGLTVKRGRWTL